MVAKLQTIGFRVWLLDNESIYSPKSYYKKFPRMISQCSSVRVYCILVDRIDIDNQGG